MVLFGSKDIEFLDARLPKMKLSDRFFENCEYENSTCFKSDDYDSNLIMTKGYASASLFFLKIIGSTESMYLRACYIYPCLFCFRHFVELSLKDTLWQYSRLGNNIDIKSISEEHNLASLWDKLLPLLSKQDAMTRNVGRLLHEFSDIDKSGTTFRYCYHFAKQDRIQNNPLIMNINHKVLYTRMLQIYRFLQGINDEIEYGIDEITSYNL